MVKACPFGQVVVPGNDHVRVFPGTEDDGALGACLGAGALMGSPRPDDRSCREHHEHGQGHDRHISRRPGQVRPEDLPRENQTGQAGGLDQGLGLLERPADVADGVRADGCAQDNLQRSSRDVKPDVVDLRLRLALEVEPEQVGGDDRYNPGEGVHHRPGLARHGHISMRGHNSTP